jgi:DnaK suppressor protein
MDAITACGTQDFPPVREGQDASSVLNQAAQPPTTQAVRFPAPDTGTVASHGIAEGLIAQRDELRARLVRLQGEALADEEVLPKYSNHPADEANVVLDRAGHEAIARVLQEELQQIEHALARLASGTYGLCEDCGQPIPPKRLAVRPTATLCVPCLSRRESQGRRLAPIPPSTTRFHQGRNVH